MKMKKIISVCLCICLMSGCDKSLRHGRPANAVAEDKGSEGVPTHSLTSDTSNASASKPSNTPTPTPEPSKSSPPSDTADTGSSVGKYVGYAIAVILSVIAVYYGVCYYIKRLELAELELAERFSVGKEYIKRMEAAGKAFDEGDDAEGYRQLDEVNALELDEANALELAELALAEYGKPKRWLLVVRREYAKRMEAIYKAFKEGDFDEMRRHEFEANQIPAYERYQYIYY